MQEKPGDLIEVKAIDSTFTGLLMPSSEETLVLKLTSGYNLGINRSKIKQIKL